MTNCEHGSLLGAYHDGEMPEEERRRMAAHLERCASCALELRRLQALSRFLASARAAEMPAGALDRLHRRLRAPEAVVLRMAEALAALAAGVLVFCLAWMSHGQAAERLTPPATWETAAMNPRDPVDPGLGAEMGIAQWIVHDLSRDNAHD